MSTTHDRDNTATPNVRENPSHMPDRDRAFSPAPALIPLTHGGGLKQLSATVGFATALFASAALVTAGLAIALPIAPMPVGCPPGTVVLPTTDSCYVPVQQNPANNPGVPMSPGAQAQTPMNPGNNPLSPGTMPASPGTPPGGNGVSAGTPPGGNGASAGTPPGGDGVLPDPNQHQHIGKPCSRSNPNCVNERS
jgi:hypothetical protein